MNYRLINKEVETPIEIDLARSKSIANRLLIAQALSNNDFEISNLSDAKDTQLLQKALQSSSTTIDVGMAGTAFRFLTAFYSIQKGKRILTGAERMKERPIKELVDQLRLLGAEIEYLEKKGFPPLKIRGGDLQAQSLQINSSVSSQFTSALLLIAPYLRKGLELNLGENSVSLPYVDLTLSILNQLGVKASRTNTYIRVEQGSYKSSIAVETESDWSSAAFFYQLVAFGKGNVLLKNLKSDSIQGDRACAGLFEQLGVETTFNSNGAFLSQIPIERKSLSFNLTDTPDLVPSIAVTASQLVDECHISGVKTLRIKESDRVEALKNELLKVGVELIDLNENEIRLLKSKKTIESGLTIETYNDHRIAMCFAPLAIKYEHVTICDVEVVEKSFPSFWEELEKAGIRKH